MADVVDRIASVAETPSTTAILPPVAEWTGARTNGTARLESTAAVCGSERSGRRFWAGRRLAGAAVAGATVVGFAVLAFSSMQDEEPSQPPQVPVEGPLGAALENLVRSVQP